MQCLKYGAWKTLNACVYIVVVKLLLLYYLWAFDKLLTMGDDVEEHQHIFPQFWEQFSFWMWFSSTLSKLVSS